MSTSPTTRWPRATRLPAERELAAKLGVSRASLSQALVALEVQGVLSVRHGDGAILVRRPTEERAIKALREHADRMPDIIEAREALEVKLAGLAAARRTDAEMAAIDAAIATMEREVDSGERGVVGDEMFHEAITVGRALFIAREADARNFWTCP